MPASRGSETSAIASAITRRLAGALAFPEHSVPVTQESFDGNRELLSAIARWRSGDALLPESALREYCLDIRWTDTLQPDLLRKVILMSARAWHVSITNGEYCEYLGDLVAALYERRGVISETLGQRVEAEFAGALRDLTLDWMGELNQIDEQCDRWIPYYSSMGCLWPDIRLFHDRWLQLETAGLARCFVSWALMLCFRDKDNPLFISRSPTPPWDHLTATDHLPWRPENMQEMRRFLDVRIMLGALDRSLARLPDHEKWLALEVRKCVEAAPAILESRIGDVFHNLSPHSDGCWSQELGIVRS